jgi:carbon storage regulator
MLALSRKNGEAIVLDQNVRIVVVKVSGSKVILGVEAPDHIKVLREELVEEDEPCLASSES